MFSSEFPQENGSSNNGSVTLTDEAGRSLSCYIERSLEVEGSEYLLLRPLDSPVEIVAWDEDDEEDEADATLIEDEEEIDAIFSDAQAVLAEQNLTLKRTAYTLTVAGELPELDEDEILTIEIEEDDLDLEPEEFQRSRAFILLSIPCYFLRGRTKLVNPSCSLLRNLVKSSHCSNPYSSHCWKNCCLMSRNRNRRDV
jgi:hypothetical protein